MKSKFIADEGGRTLAAVFDKGEEVAAGLLEIARRHNLTAASFTAIGALSDVTLGYFDRERKDYKKIPIREQVEVLALTGNIALSDDQPKAHAHVVVGKSDGTAHGGHLLEAHVWPTLEVIVVESPQYLQRKFDRATGLTLIDPGA
jgi:predicted DNA-binding protein with PD1-like motif